MPPDLRIGRRIGLLSGSDWWTSNNIEHRLYQPPIGQLENLGLLAEAEVGRIVRVEVAVVGADARHGTEIAVHEGVRLLE